LNVAVLDIIANAGSGAQVTDAPELANAAGEVNANVVSQQDEETPSQLEVE